jgi:hypothetical protein
MSSGFINVITFCNVTISKQSRKIKKVMPNISGRIISVRIQRSTLERKSAISKTMYKQLIAIMGIRRARRAFVKGVL